MSRTMTTSQTNPIAAVAGDGSLYAVDKMDAHIQGLLHLAVSVFVFDRDYLLIQKRASGKYHSGGQWANTCCSHPNWGEGVDRCAGRRLEEELGFTLPLTRHETIEYQASVGNGLSEHERVTLYSAEANRADLSIQPDPNEVAAFRWIAHDELRQEVDRKPDAFTPWFRIYLQRYPRLNFA
jgi:isopentenyl-diphosphate Delta-isomerase